MSKHAMAGLCPGGASPDASVRSDHKGREHLMCVDKDVHARGSDGEGEQWTEIGGEGAPLQTVERAREHALRASLRLSRWHHSPARH